MLLGIDIGGTKCAVILGDAEGEERITILDKIVMPTNKPAYEMIDEFEKAKKTNVIRKLLLFIILSNLRLGVYQI